MATRRSTRSTKVVTPEPEPEEEVPLGSIVIDAGDDDDDDDEQQLASSDEEGSAKATLADCQVNHACETDPNNCATATFCTCSKDEEWDQANNVGQMPGVCTGKLIKCDGTAYVTA